MHPWPYLQGPSQVRRTLPGPLRSQFPRALQFKFGPRNPAPPPGVNRGFSPNTPFPGSDKSPLRVRDFHRVQGSGIYAPVNLSAHNPAPKDPPPEAGSGTPGVGFPDVRRNRRRRPQWREEAGSCAHQEETGPWGPGWATRVALSTPAPPRPRPRPRPNAPQDEEPKQVVPPPPGLGVGPGVARRQSQSLKANQGGLGFRHGPLCKNV